MVGCVSPSSTPPVMIQWDMRAVRRGGVQSRVWRRSCCRWSACWQVLDMPLFEHLYGSVSLWPSVLYSDLCNKLLKLRLKLQTYQRFSFKCFNASPLLFPLLVSSLISFSCFHSLSPFVSFSYLLSCFLVCPLLLPPFLYSCPLLPPLLSPHLVFSFACCPCLLVSFPCLLSICTLIVSSPHVFSSSSFVFSPLSSLPLHVASCPLTLLVCSCHVSLISLSSPCLLVSSQSLTMKVERTLTPLKCGGRTVSSFTNLPRRSYARLWAFRDDAITVC